MICLGFEAPDALPHRQKENRMVARVIFRYDSSKLCI